MLGLGAKYSWVLPEPCLLPASTVGSRFFRMRQSRDVSELSPGPSDAARGSGAEGKGKTGFLCWRCAWFLTRLVKWRAGRD